VVVNAMVTPQHAPGAVHVVVTGRRHGGDQRRGGERHDDHGGDAHAGDTAW
jgi:hypothetical protein